MRPSTILMPILCVILLLAICPVYSYNPIEFDCVTGGIGDKLQYHTNILGIFGTKLAYGYLMTFGLAGYPLAILMFISSIRRLLWRNNLRNTSWEYLASFLLFGIGLAMLLGITPENFSKWTEYLNIASIPGGVIGQRLSSPEGCLTYTMNSTVSTVVSGILIFIPLAIIWYFDWRDFFNGLFPARPSKTNDVYSGDDFTETEAEKPKKKTSAPKQEEPEIVPPPKQEEPVKAKQEIDIPKPIGNGKYEYPNVTLLDQIDDSNYLGANAREIERNTKLLQKTFDDFKVDAKVVSQVSAPQVTQFEVLPAPGVKLSVITSLENNIKMELAAQSLRILAPIPGKNLVGIQVPNEKRAVISVRSMMLDDVWKKSKERIPLLLGKNINGKNVILDLAKAPHLLIAGTTGSGKSVCMNLLITSMLFKFSPDELRLIMVDPKVVEFSAYKKLPHLVVPIINDVNQVALALRWAINEMEHRYRILAAAGVRNLEDYNKRSNVSEEILDDLGNPIPEKMPYIVIIIDELADIMAIARKEVEQCLSRIAAKSRAVGIHTIIATQRPDTKVITGTIKSNYPVRIAFRVASHIDSQTIIGSKGAESLLGLGDMLYMPPGGGAIDRIQCGMASDEERNRVVAFAAMQMEQHFDDTVLAEADDSADGGMDDGGNTFPDDVSTGAAGGEEGMIQKAIQIILESRRPTVSYLQRTMGIGYNKAATIMEELEKRGVVSKQINNAPRQILISSPSSLNSQNEDSDDDF